MRTWSVKHCRCVFVCLVTDMAEPIQQLTTNNQGQSQREHVPFTLLARKEKVPSLRSLHTHLTLQQEEKKKMKTRQGAPMTVRSATSKLLKEIYK